MVLVLCYTSTMKAQTQEDRAVIAINTRYPKEVYDAIMRLAKKHKRSFHAEVLWALQTYVEQYERTAHDE